MGVVAVLVAMEAAPEETEVVMGEVGADMVAVQVVALAGAEVEAMEETEDLSK